ncbi:MAG TPA: hypothetical protein VF377_10360 [Acidimicrobiia bacterium]
MTEITWGLVGFLLAMVTGAVVETHFRTRNRIWGELLAAAAGVDVLLLWSVIILEVAA